jgi:pimeloyl-ACP methyl ester carboxylesterase
MTTLKRWTVVIASIVLGAWADRTMAQTAPSGPPPGALLDIGGHKLHVRCIGPSGKGPTVVLEAGGGGFSTTWSRVQALLAPRVKTCAYDRAGFGWSEKGPRPSTMRQAVFELHALLEAAMESGPFVLVGHSVGGLLVRLYSEVHDSDVVGMVLVDPTHESEVLFSLKEGQWYRLREQATGRVVPEPRGDGAASTQSRPEDDYQAEEFQRIYLSRKANPQPLGNRPLIVLGAGRRPAPPGTADDFWSHLRTEKDGQRIDLARLSRNAKFILDPSSGHEIQTDNPQLVARAIEEVVEAASKGNQLVP